MLNLLFHRKKKLNKSERDRAHDSYIALAVRSGFVEQRDGNYEITEYGFKNGCYKTKNGGIGFAGQSVLMLANNYISGGE